MDKGGLDTLPNKLQKHEAPTEDMAVAGGNAHTLKYGRSVGEDSAGRPGRHNLLFNVAIIETNGSLSQASVVHIIHRELDLKYPKRLVCWLVIDDTFSTMLCSAIGV